MKHLFSIMIVIGIVGLLVAPGLAGDPRHSIQGLFGHGGRAQFVTINFEHDTQFDEPLWPVCGSQSLEHIPGLERWCGITHVPAPPPDPGVVLTGDVEGFNVLLSDVICFDGVPFGSPPATSGRVEAPGYISGTLVDTGEPIHMMGRMVLDIDFNEFPFPMKGIWVFDKGFGTHHGVLRVKGTSDGFVGTGTYSGWIWENH